MLETARNCYKLLEIAQKIVRDRVFDKLGTFLLTY